MVESKFFFICDRKKTCSKNAICGIYCRHTTDEEHRMHREPVIPWNDDRFESVTVADENKVYYIEREWKA